MRARRPACMPAGARPPGPLRPDVNRYLKWAFVEAANTHVASVHAIPIAMSVTSMSASPAQGTSESDRRRRPGISPRPPIGC